MNARLLCLTLGVSKRHVALVSSEGEEDMNLDVTSFSKLISCIFLLSNVVAAEIC